MERFKNIDWNPPLEEMINTVFINDERLERDSAMYKILNGSFADPFEDMDDDYANVNLSLMKEFDKEIDFSYKDIDDFSNKDDDSSNQDIDDFSDEKKDIEQEVGNKDLTINEDLETNKTEVTESIKSSTKRKRTESCTKGKSPESSTKKRSTESSIKKENPESFMKKESTESSTKKENLESSTKKKSSESSTKKKNTKNSTHDKKNLQKIYVPGIRKVQFPFHRSSHLDTAQQAMCLRVLLRSSNNLEQKISAKDKKEFESYKQLQSIIHEEQNEFLKVVRSRWNIMIFIPIRYEPFITSKWNKKIQQVQQLPRYYMECTNISFSSDKNFTVLFESCLQQGVFPKMVLPNLKQQNLLQVHHITLLQKYQPHITPNNVTPHFKLPVSVDTHCEKLAKENKVDLVISSSGLKCLANIMGSGCSNSWMIPLVIKSHQGKNTIYIGKKLPAASATAPEKNISIYKYVIKHILINTKNKSPEEATCSTENEFNQANDHFEIPEDLSSSEPTSDKSTVDDKTSFEKDKLQNVTYNLFTIQPDVMEINKNLFKKYKILVRTKIDALEILPNGKSQLQMLAPKLEHQLDYGAEAMTLSEGLQQWISLLFRPETSLLRVRISSDTSEIIQVERHTTSTLSYEIKRLYNMKAQDSLKTLYNVIEQLSSVEPGSYLLRHTLENGPFAIVYRETGQQGKSIFDLHTVYQSNIFETIPKVPWPPIDRILTLPTHRHFHRMPAMFFPRKIKKKQTVQLRKSLRGKRKME